jgi:isoamylase
MKTKTGLANPLGLSHCCEGFINFAIHAPQAREIALVFFEKGQECLKITLDKTLHKTGSIWHIAIEENIVLSKEYLFCIDQAKFVIDPYAKFLNTSSVWGTGAPALMTKAIVRFPEAFDWENTPPPQHKLNELIIYEMHTRSFTIHAKCKNQGTFLGIIEKISHFKALGINAIELMPIHEFNECENPNPGLYNYWGYSPISFFAFMSRYSTKSENVLDEFKTLVRELHKNNISIIIDVVYNHTAEGGINGPTYHFKDLDPEYYLRDKKGHLVDFSGCGNTLNANKNPGMSLILDSLRYLAIECRVDGFRFDLASTFYRDSEQVLHHPRIIEAILDDPVLSKKILIAEAWDAHGLYQVGRFPKPFADWNGAYRDKLRSFLNHFPHAKGGFADALSGTCSLYFEKTPSHAINFITAHDGFTLRDLYSYNTKHNQNNLENNKDGSDHNLSKNYGHEGHTNDPVVEGTRKKMMRLSFALLLLSLGTPMILMGDEYGHTRLGNNNAYCQDNALNYFLWDQLDAEMVSYIRSLIELRKTIKRLQESKFYEKHEVSWHGLSLDDPQWNQDDSVLILHIHTGYLFIINNSSESKQYHLPQGQWYLLFDSNHNKKHSIHPLSSSHHMIEEHSMLILGDKPPTFFDKHD